MRYAGRYYRSIVIKGTKEIRVLAVDSDVSVWDSIQSNVQGFGRRV